MRSVVEDFFGSPVGQDGGVVGGDGVEEGLEVVASGGGGEAAGVGGEGGAVDEDDGVAVVNDFFLGFGAVGAGGDVDADPAALEACDDAGDLVGADGGGG
jgi:hypothetical protein